MKKPSWLNKKIDLSLSRKTKEILKTHHLSTVCEEARCPNISECFSKGTATFMILGDVCTRDCAFCGVRKGIPTKVGLDEPERVKEAVRRLRLKYVVITSPTRDDLPDGGAIHFARTIHEVRSLPFVKKIEVLIPDLLGVETNVYPILESGPGVVGHNVETVPSLYTKIRPKADYERSIHIIKKIKEYSPHIFSKSGLMLGLGEKEHEVTRVLEDLREVRCDFLSIGQYLPPSKNHYPLCEYASPETFSHWQKVGLQMGFKKVLSAPYVRSSYLAHTYFEG